MARLGDLFPEELQTGKPEAKAASAQVGRASLPVDSARARPQGPGGAKAGAKVSARVFVKDFVPGQEIEGVYLIGEATIRVARNGSKYIQASFCDKSGSIPARQWDATDVDYQCYKASGYVKARGRAEMYKNAMQLVVFAVQEWDAEALDPGDFLPLSTRPLEEMDKELSALLETFTDPDYKRLLQAIFGDESVRAKFVKGPAAAAVHHAWIGGLLEHVLSACKTAEAIAQQRPFLNRDLLLAGVVLHDIGKIEEISAGPGFSYTDSGKLCGHIVLGALLVDRFIQKLENFPAAKRDLILHMILSHHGTHEFGSPVTPFTGEAMALHHLECLDAKVQGIQSIIERERAAGNEGAWTDFARVVDGRIYMGP